MLLGLVGKSCSGKNFVGSILEEKGLVVWDMDRVCHDILDENALEAQKLFGSEILLNKDGKLCVNRSVLGKKVFSDSNERAKLEGLLYPKLEMKVKAWLSENPGRVLVINGALLYRSGFDRLCDAIIYVDASYEVRKNRAMERDNIDEKTFLLRENAQADVDFRTVEYRCPVYIVQNEGAYIHEVNRQVFSICDKLGILGVE